MSLYIPTKYAATDFFQSSCRIFSRGDADGDETEHVEGDDTPDEGSDDKAGGRVRDNYNMLKGII